MGSDRLRAAMRGVAVVLVTLVVTGLVLRALLIPPVTALLSSRWSQADSETNPAPGTSQAIAEQVRAVVAGSTALGTLPYDPAGVIGFDERSVGHLGDVGTVISRAFAVTLVCCGLLAALLVVACRRHSWADIAFVLVRGGMTCVVVPLVLALLAVVSFDAFFTAFHGLFFSAGTWTFDSNSLLIRLFPEGFWREAGLMWGVGIMLFGVVLGVSGWILGDRSRVTSPHEIVKEA